MIGEQVTIGAECARRTRVSLARSIIFGGLAAAVVDAAYFTLKALVEGVSSVRVLQGIAGFWLGKAASTGGLGSAALGAATHVGLATIMAAGFVMLQSRTHVSRASTLRAGVVYGICLYLIMYGIVLPLRWPQVFPSFSNWTSVFDLLVHVAVGLAIVAVVRKSCRLT